MMYVRSPILYLLSAWTFTCFLGWFIVEIIIHSEPDTLNVQPLAEQSLQLFMYTSLLSLASLCACWYADFVRTRAARAAALCVTTFTTFAWIWNLWFVIPVFYGQNDSSNVYCNGNVYNSNHWCDLSRAAAALSVAMAFGLFFGQWMWAFFTYITSLAPEIPIPTQATILAPHGSNVSAQESGAHNADVNWRTELTEPDDLELMKIAAMNPNTHGMIHYRTSFMGYISSFFTFLSLVGFVVLTLSLIEISRDLGVTGWDTTEANHLRLGDPIVAANWYWLTLTLGTSLAVSSYSSYRRNRGIIGSAYLLAVMTTLQWVSIFVYSARRANQQSSQSNDGYNISSITPATNSQYLEVACIGLIAFSELLKSAILLVRYMTYMPVSKLDHDRVHIPSHVDAPTVVIAEKDAYNPNVTTEYNGRTVVTDANNHPHVHGAQQEMNVPGPSYDPQDADYYMPSYNMSIFHGASLGFRFLFVLQALTIFGWFVMQLVAECSSGLFTQYQSQSNDPFGVTGSNQDRTYYFTEYMFLLTSVLVVGAWMAAFFAEREVSVSSALSSMYTSALMTLGYFLLVWPFAYQAIYNDGALYNNANNADRIWIRMTQAAAVFAMVNAFCLTLLFLHSMIRLAERRAMITTWELSRQNIPSSVAWLMICGMAVWAFSTLYYGLFLEELQAQERTSTNPASPFKNYFASQAFLVLTAVAITTWAGCYASKLLYAWQSWSWRMVSFFTALVTAAFLVPMLILACRFINYGGLANGELALASGIIILTSGAVFYLATFLFLVHSSFYSAGPAGAAIPPTGMALRNHEQFVAQKNEQGVLVKDGAYAGAPVVAGTYNKNTTYAETQQPVVNPRTGDMGVAETRVPIAEETRTDEPVVYETTSSYGAEPQNMTRQTIPLDGNNQAIRYHDY